MNIPDRPLESEEYYEELEKERKLKRQAREERELDEYINSLYK